MSVHLAPRRQRQEWEGGHKIRKRLTSKAWTHGLETRACAGTDDDCPKNQRCARYELPTLQNKSNTQEACRCYLWVSFTQCLRDLILDHWYLCTSVKGRKVHACMRTIEPFRWVGPSPNQTDLSRQSSTFDTLGHVNGSVVCGVGLSINLDAYGLGLYAPAHNICGRTSVAGQLEGAVEVKLH